LLGDCLLLGTFFKVTKEGQHFWLLSSTMIVKKERKEE
jgi:hypothetical protein